MSLSHNAGGFLALLCLIGDFLSGWRRRLVEKLKMSADFIGLVELKGSLSGLRRQVPALAGPGSALEGVLIQQPGEAPHPLPARGLR